MSKTFLSGGPTRRDLLAAVAVGAAGLATIGDLAAAPPEQSPKAKAVEEIVTDFLFESIDDLRAVLIRQFPNDRIEATGERGSYTIKVDDGVHEVICQIAVTSS